MDKDKKQNISIVFWAVLLIINIIIAVIRWKK